MMEDKTHKRKMLKIKMLEHLSESITFQYPRKNSNDPWVYVNIIDGEIVEYEEDGDKWLK